MLRHAGLIAILLAMPTFAADGEVKQTEKLPIEATLVSGQEKYELKLDGKTPADYAKMIKDAGKNPRALPPAAVVDLKLVLKNTGKEDIQIWVKGDTTEMKLVLEGEGTVNVKAQLAFTREFRLPVPMKIEAGKSIELPIKSLSFGFRGTAERAYWTQPGDYTLKAVFVTGVSPSPGEVKADESGFGKVQIVTPAIKLKVVEVK